MKMDQQPGEKIRAVPAQYRANLDVEAPFGTNTPVLTEAEIADVTAFLGTLSDRDVIVRH